MSRKFFFCLMILFCLVSCDTMTSRFYYPVRGESWQTPENLGLVYENVWFPSADGTRLHGWFIPAVGKEKGIILHVHGNAGNLGAHLGIASWLPKEGYSLFMFDYRGYGLSDDSRPSPQGLMEDTRAALFWLIKEKKVNAARILGWGHSLGGNNLIAALAKPDENGEKTRIAGVVLDSTFEAYSTIANEKLPFSGYLLSDHYSANRLIQSLAPTPLFILHGDADNLIPMQHSEHLFERAMPPKELYISRGAGHTNASMGAGAKKAVLAFFEKTLGVPAVLP